MLLVDFYDLVRDRTYDMTYLFFFGFIFIFGAGYIFAGAIVIWGIVTVVAFLLSKILGLFNFKRQKSEAPISAKTANLADPIGAMSIVAQKYNDFHFLKDIAFLEVQLFGRNSNEVIEQFRSAESDPRPEVCGACANKMLLRISQERNIRLNNGRWSHEQEESWERGTPREWRLVIDQFSKAS